MYARPYSRAFVSSNCSASHHVGGTSPSVDRVRSKVAGRPSEVRFRLGGEVEGRMQPLGVRVRRHVEVQRDDGEIFGRQLYDVVGEAGVHYRRSGGGVERT